MIITVLGSIGPWVPGLLQALAIGFPASNTQIQTGCSSPLPNSTSVASNLRTPLCPIPGIVPNDVGSNQLSDLSLPNTILSNVDGLVGEGNVIQSSSDNLTLYNLGVRIRLLGGPLPHDELLGTNLRPLSSSSFWRVEAQAGQMWIPLLPISNNFTILGTSSSGTTVVRIMQVKSGTVSGVLRVIYHALPNGSLKWDLQFTSGSLATYRLNYEWLNVTNRASLSALAHQFQVGYGVENYTLSWNDIPSWTSVTTAANATKFSLAVNIGQITSGVTVSVDPTISSSTDSSASGFTFQRKVFFDPKGGYYFAFYYDGAAVGYSSSRDGISWSTRQPMAPNWPAFTDTPASFPSIYVIGQTIIAAAGQSFTRICSTNPCNISGSASLYFAQGRISGSSISWQPTATEDTLPIACSIPPCTALVSIRYVTVALDANGLLVFSYTGLLQGSDGYGVCTYGTTFESDVFVIFNSQRFSAVCDPNTNIDERSVVLSSPGGARVIYTAHQGSRVQLMSRFLHGSGSSLAAVTPSADTYTEDSNKDANYGTRTYFDVERNLGVTRIGYVRFDLPSIPNNSQFSKATLTLTWFTGFDDNVGAMYLGRVSGSWSETGLTWNTPGVYPTTPYVAIPSFRCGDYGCSTGTTGPLDITPVVRENYLCCNYGVSLQIGGSSATAYDFAAREYGSSTAPSLRVYYNCCMESAQTVEGNMFGYDSFSAVTDTNNAIHVVYSSNSDENVTEAFLGTNSVWGWNKNILGRSAFNPTITIDTSTNDAYAFGVVGQTSIVMAKKTTFGQWSDNQAVFPVTRRGNIAHLSSNALSASATNSSTVILLWTDGFGPYNVTSALIPIQTVWSPYSDPPSPWDRSGIAPYGQYFSNLGESVSPSTGMLTVEQRDLSVPGRRLNLDITRVYTEPYSFLGSTPYNYETYPWAPLGDGWQLNFPWMNNTVQPLYLHLADGQGYRIPYSFWAGATSTFENHQGENFRLVRYLNGTIALYDRSGISYSFATSPNHALRYITDSTGNNTITFSYSNNVISCVVDTVNRAFAFNYTSGLLRSIKQASGSCSSPGNIIRTISYANNGPSLVSATDAGQRTTYYSYNATSGSAMPWLLSRIRYPTSWMTNYTFAMAVLGTTANTYRVTQQKTGPSPTSPIRQFIYTYSNPMGDQITAATITTYNGTLVAIHAYYGFSFAGMSKNITDSGNNFVSGIVQRFGVNGQIPRETVLTSPTQGYTNYYTYDLWGNQIYSRRAINPSASLSHESFNSYYHNGEPPGFYAFQDSFSRNQGTAPDNSWNVTNGYWMVGNGIYNGTETNGSQENMVSYADVGKSDISISANLYITRKVNTTSNYTNRVGLFAHYNASKTVSYKWALVFVDDGSTKTLRLLDDMNTWGPNVPCNFTPGAWYAFNMTLHGYQVNGTVVTQGQAPCNLSWTFPTNSPAASGTSFGLYAGAYSALFDDVRVTTVSPYITGTGFSNSFIQNGAPGPIGLNAWLATTKPPGLGWNTTANWLPAEGWSPAYAVQNYGGPYWNNNVNGWTDNNAQWIWWSRNSNNSASPDPVWFRRLFTVNTTTTLNIQATADNSFVVYVDGTLCSVQNDGMWTTPRSCTTQTLQPGRFHVLAVNATNPDGQSPTQPNPDPAGLLLTASANGRFLLRTDGVGGQNIPATAGSAQLQNGRTSSPSETYYGYYPWGGVNQTQSRYNPFTSQGATNPLTTNGSAQTFCSNTSSSCTASLSTTHPNDVIVAFLTEDLDSPGNSCTFAIADAKGLSWFARTGIVFSQTGRDEIQEFWTTSSAVLTSDSITESILGCGNNSNGLQVFAISGANIVQPFDPSFGVPGYSSGSASGTGILPTAWLSTANPTDIVFAGIDSQGGVTSPGPGFRTINSDNGAHATDYSLVNGTITNSPVTFTDNGQLFYWGEIADAVQANPPTQWLVSTRRYDTYGNLNLLTDPKGNRTSYDYSSAYKSAYLTSQNQILVPSGTMISRSYTYNLTLGTMLTSVDANGNTMSYQYDILGRATRLTYLQTGDYLAYQYNDVSNYVNITNENLWKTQQVYDGLGRLSRYQRFAGGTGEGASFSNETYTYNWQDRVINHLDTVGNLYNYTYDALGRITQTKKPDGNITTVTYSDVSSWAKAYDENGVGTCEIFDRLGRLVTVIENSTYLCSTGMVTNYFYDEVGNLREVTTANAQATSYTYDDLNRLVRISSPDATGESYIYDNNGNLANKIDRSSNQISYSYDSLNRILNITYQGMASKDQYSYDKNGNLLSLKSQNTTLTYTYDTRNRVLCEAYTVNGGVPDGPCGTGGSSPLRQSSSVSGGIYGAGYSFVHYYVGEAMVQLTYNDYMTAGYIYDGLGRVKSLQLTGVAPATNFTYYKNDEIKGIQYGNKLVANYTYNKLGTISQLKLKNNVTNTVLMILNYQYNKTGTVASVIGNLTNTAGSLFTVNEQYSYDALHRLVNSCVKTGGVITTSSYSYDPVGNRISQKINGITTTYNLNLPNNELIGSSTSGSSGTSGYDARGNLISRNVTGIGASHWTYKWNIQGSLLSVANDSGAQGFYAYDGLGRRVEVKESASYVYNGFLGTETLADIIVTAPENDYVYADGLRIARVNNAGGFNPSIVYYESDAIGNTRIVTSSTRTVLFSDSYQPYGQDNSASGSETYRFTGKPVSQTTGLYYDYQRWYDPTVGRFISQDPLPGPLSVPQSLDRYVYVRNEPTVLSDPTGMVDCWGPAGSGYCEGPGGKEFNAESRDPSAICTDDLKSCEMCANPIFDTCHYVDASTRGGSGTSSAGDSGYASPSPGDAVTPTDPAATTPTIDTNPTLMSDASLSSTTGRTVVVGEDMPGRVQSFASQNGYDTMPRLSNELSDSEKLSANRAWIRGCMDEGCTIVDIGPAPNNPNYPNYPYISSPYYAVEQAELAARNYARWIMMWGVVE